MESNGNQLKPMEIYGLLDDRMHNDGGLVDYIMDNNGGLVVD